MCSPQIDDILIGKDGARFFEDIIIYRQREKPALLSSIAILRCDKSKILPDFLYYALRTPSFKQDVKDNYGSGSAIPRIILKDFKRMMVSYPSLEKQRSVISVLTAIDSKIQANTEINDNLQQQAQAIYSSMFIDKRFMAFFKLLHGCEDNAVCLSVCKQFFQILAAFGVLRRLPEKIFAAGELPVKLVIQIVTVSNDNDSGAF